MSQIAFIGLGHMGAPMVQNLARANHSIKIYDIDPDAIHAVSGQGITPATTLADAVQDADVVFTMLQTGTQVAACCLGEQGIFDCLSKTAVFVDCSTISVKESKSLHQKADEFGLMMLDAPVSGGVAAAEAGHLTFMVAGEEAVFSTLQPILSSMAKKVLYVGDAGNGVVAKLCNNMVLGVSMIAVSEAFHLAKHLGLDEKTLHQVMSQSSADCWVIDQYCPVPGILADVPADHDYKPGFSAAMMLKDLMLSQDAAKQVNVSTQLGSTAQSAYNKFVAQNDRNAKLDFSAIIQMLEESS